MRKKELVAFTWKWWWQHQQQQQQQHIMMTTIAKGNDGDNYCNDDDDEKTDSNYKSYGRCSDFFFSRICSVDQDRVSWEID